MANLPYLASPGSLRTALERIRSAATPPRVTGDFVQTVLQIKGGTGRVLPPYLKRIGFVGTDGTPTDLYKRFRNSATAGAAIADAMKVGYKDLLQANEYFYRLDDKKLLDLIIQVTGAEAQSSVAKLTLSALKILIALANFEATAPAEPAEATAEPLPDVVRVDTEARALGLNLSYTINLNLPATSDQAVFNAIFRSLKEHLLK